VLLDAVRRTLARYCILPSRHAYTAVTLYCAYTHAAPVFDFAPRLVLTSPEKRSGKTRCMEIIGLLSRKPFHTANASVAALYRSLDEPITVLLDEADTIFGTRLKADQNEDLRGFLNAGFQRGTPVKRWNAADRSVEDLNTFAPVVLAAIGRLPDTVTDRAINIAMRRRKPSEVVEPFRISRDAEPLKALAYELGVWTDDHSADLKRARPDMPVVDRAADLWEPLIAVADLAGGSWPAAARAAAVALTEDAAHADADHSAGHELLTNVRDVLAAAHGEFVATETLIAALVALPESRWADEGLTGRRLALLLKPYGVAVGRNPSTSKRERGYRRTDFTDAFERYLKPAESDGVVMSQGIGDGSAPDVGGTSLRVSVPAWSPSRRPIPPSASPSLTDRPPWSVERLWACWP